MADNNEEKLARLRRIVSDFREQGRYDLILQGIGSATLERLSIEAARDGLSPLLITRDNRFVLTKWNKEVELSPLHKALYILFLRHPEGIEFKSLSEYADELMEIYTPMCNRVSSGVIRDSVERLANPLDNAINEKCSRIKSAFAVHMDAYSLRYYIITGHVERRIDGSDRQWFERRKAISLPRHLVVWE